MATKGYQSYRGRMPRWKKILIAVLILILIAAGLFLFLQDYQVFDRDGAHLNLPGVGQNQPASSDEEGNAGNEVDLHIQEPAANTEELYGRTLDLASLESEDFSELQEGERPVFVMKAANGTMYDGDTALLREKIAGRDAVARLSCFADTQRADEDNSMAIMSVSGRAWRDPDGNSWLSPYSQAACDELLAMVRQCVELGFTEIVLDDVQFPNYGRVERMTFGDQEDTPQLRVNAILAFLDAVNTELEGTGVTLSIALPSDLLETQTDETAGWDLNAIAQKVDRIYMDAAGQTEADAARTALSALRGDVDGKVFYVAETGEPVTGGSYVIG